MSFGLLQWLQRPHPDDEEAFRKATLDFFHVDAIASLLEESPPICKGSGHGRVIWVKVVDVPPRTIFLNPNPSAFSQACFGPPKVRDQLCISQLSQAPLMPDQVVCVRLRRPGFKTDIVDSADAISLPELCKISSFRYLVGKLKHRFYDVDGMGDGGEEIERNATDACTAVDCSSDWKVCARCVCLIGPNRLASFLIFCTVCGPMPVGSLGPSSSLSKRALALKFGEEIFGALNVGSADLRDSSGAGLLALAIGSG